MNDYDYPATGGLPVVAHTYLCLKDSNGDWIKTELGGKKKKDATVRKYTYTKDNIDILTGYLSAPLESFVYLKEEPLFVFFGSVPIMRTTYRPEQIHIGGVQYVPLKGDFTDSLKEVDKEVGGNYGGYSLISNNCLHYVRDILKLGEAHDNNVEEYLENSTTIVPDVFYDGLYNVTQ